MRAVVVLLSLAVVALSKETGVIKVVHNGEYRVDMAISWAEIDMIYEPVKKTLVPSNFKASTPSDANAISATAADPYVFKLQDATQSYVVAKYRDLSEKEIQPEEWKSLFSDQIRVNGTRCYWLGGTAKSPTWSLYTGKDVAGCSP